MRWNALLIACLAASVALSGCFGGDDTKDDDDLLTVDPCANTLDGQGDAAQEDTSAADESADEPVDPLNGTLAMLASRQIEEDNGTMDDLAATTGAVSECPGTNVNSAPNVAPVANLTMTSTAGVVQDGTNYILAGENVTFSAAASTDDSSIQLAALTVRDSNGTRTVQLYSDGFVDAVLSFAHEGAVNVTLRVLDDDGAVDVLDVMLYVNSLKSVSVPVDLALPTGHSADACDYPELGENLLWQRFMDHAKFSVQSNARWLSAEMTAGSGQFALCSPEQVALSEASSTTAESARGGDPLVSSPLYSVFALATGGVSTMTFDVMVHYEP